VSSVGSEDWRALAVQGGRFATQPEALLGVLRRLGTRCRYALVRNGRGEPVAAGLGVTSEERLGVYAMYTAPQARRSGAARALLQAFAQYARVEALDELYLLVEVDNLPARALYAQCGFHELYPYHY